MKLTHHSLQCRSDVIHPCELARYAYYEFVRYIASTSLFKVITQLVIARVKSSQGLNVRSVRTLSFTHRPLALSRHLPYVSRRM